MCCHVVCPIEVCCHPVTLASGPELPSQSCCPPQSRWRLSMSLVRCILSLLRLLHKTGDGVPRAGTDVSSVPELIAVPQRSLPGRLPSCLVWHVASEGLIWLQFLPGASGWSPIHTLSSEDDSGNSGSSLQGP